MADFRLPAFWLAFSLTACLWAAPLAPEAFAQPARPGGASGPIERLYNPNSTETVSGTVTGIERTTSWRTGQPGVHLVLKTAKETLPVHLGPAWFIDNQDLQVKVGDRLDVTGSRITFNGKPALVAASVTKGDQVLTLRDKTGRPVWAGWRRR